MNGSRGSQLGLSASAVLAPLCIVTFGVSASSLALSLAPSIAAACLERIRFAIQSALLPHRGCSECCLLAAVHCGLFLRDTLY